MRSITAISTAGLLLAAAEAALAAPMSYDSDTAAGSFSELSQVQDGPAYHVRGTITPLQWREHERWLASGQVRLETGDGSRSIAVQVIRPRGAERASFAITVDSGNRPITTTIGEVGLNEAVPFDVTLFPSGDAVVQFGTERRVYHLDLGRNLHVKVVCSTGEFLFGELDLGG